MQRSQGSAALLAMDGSSPAPSSKSTARCVGSRYDGQGGAAGRGEEPGLSGSSVE